MKETQSCQPTPPCLNVSHLTPVARVHPMVLMHEGWVAARNGEPKHLGAGEAWLVGWDWWHRHHPPAPKMPWER